ncbi:hypothetical protein PAEPH01_1997 [Pancytospora epiphaga]|nr:hypothetical protein PAEPH01_1997 [Pancytospora epiphaga]
MRRQMGWYFRLIKYLFVGFANKLWQEYRCGMRIIPYVMTWDGVVTNYHRGHLKDIGMTDFV